MMVDMYNQYLGINKICPQTSDWCPGVRPRFSKNVPIFTTDDDTHDREWSGVWRMLFFRGPKGKSSCWDFSMFETNQLGFVHVFLGGWVVRGLSG